MPVNFITFARLLSKSVSACFMAMFFSSRYAIAA